MPEPPSLEEFSTQERLRRLLKPSVSPYSPASALVREHPSGWEPGVAWDGTKGVVTSRPTDSSEPQWEILLKSWGFDPVLYEVVEPVQIRTWDGFGKNAEGNLETRQLWYHRASIRSRLPVTDRADIEALCREIRSHKPRATLAPTGAPSSLVVCLSDWQAGKGEGGGTEALVGRVLAAIDGVTVRMRELRRSGRPVSQLTVVGMGDLVENCDGHYEMQTFSVDLDRRDQVKVVRRLLVKAITTWAPMVERMVASAVPGNHGENRKNGKAFTTFGDNDDVAVMEQVAEVIGSNPAFAHVSFLIPHNEMVVTLNVCGTVVAFAHGHQARAPGMAQQKLRTWWEKQAFGMRAAGDAVILTTGHFHHWSGISHGGRTHFQCPTLDGGSRWFEETVGQESVAGTLTYVVDAHGWRDIAVL